MLAPVMAGLRAAGKPLWNLASKGRYNPLRSRIPGGRDSPLPRVGGQFAKPVPAGSLNPQAHPLRFSAAATGAGIGIPMMFGGGEDPQAQQQYSPGGIYETQQQWKPPTDIGSYAEFQAEEGKRQAVLLKQIMNQYMVISFVAGKEAAVDYLDSAEKILKATKTTRGATRESQVYDAVFGNKKNLPSNAKQVYNRISTAGGSPEYAAQISGYIGEATKLDASSVAKENKYTLMQDLQRLFYINPEEAVKQLVAAWGGGLLGNPPLGGPEMQRERAYQLLSGGQLGGETIDLVENIRPKS